MRAYIIRRLLLVVPTVFLAATIVFFMIRLIPGSMIDIMASQMAYFTKTSRAAIEHELGFDVPLFTQYWRWMGALFLHGDLGASLWKKTPVVYEILIRWPVTFELGLLGLIVAQVIALPVGIYSALRQDTWGDYVGRSVAILCIAVPSFWLATMVVVLPSIWWGYMPSIIYIPFMENPIENLKMVIIPAIVLGMYVSGITMRMTRSMMLEVLRQDYIRTAWAKGLRERVVVLRHAVKNALIPVITLLGLYVPIVFGGAVIIEQIFGLPGIVRLTYQSVSMRDYSIVSGILVFNAVVVLLITLIVDLTYAFLDPRIRYR